MPTSSRKITIGKGNDGTYHASSVCLEHTILDGIHPVTGKRKTNRRTWIAQRAGELQTIFAIRVRAAAVADRRVDLILTCLPEVAAKWSPEEVVWRWSLLFGKTLGIMNRKSLPELAAKKSTVAAWRKRLCSVSWFMRAFNEWLARNINREEQRRGMFWAGRFNCARLEKADVVAAAAAFVGHQLIIPPVGKPQLFPGLRALPEAPQGRIKSPKRLRKSRSPNLTADQKIEICRRLTAGESKESLAAEYGRCTATIERLKKLKDAGAAAISGKHLTKAECAWLRKQLARITPVRAKNGRMTHHPNHIHFFAEEAFGRKLSFQPFTSFCRQLTTH